MNVESSPSTLPVADAPVTPARNSRISPRKTTISRSSLSTRANSSPPDGLLGMLPDELSDELKPSPTAALDASSFAVPGDLFFSRRASATPATPPINAPKLIEKSFDTAATIPSTAPITANITLIASLVYCLLWRDPFVARFKPQVARWQYGENRRAEYHVSPTFKPSRRRSCMSTLVR
ncbi:hypothetical protein PQQ95_21990 [Paraburkholderia caffeinilytica]